MSYPQEEGEYAKKAAYMEADSRDSSPLESVLNQNDDLLEILSQNIFDLKNHLKPITEEQSPEQPVGTTQGLIEPRRGSSPFMDRFYTQQNRINNAITNVRELNRSLEV